MRKRKKVAVSIALAISVVLGGFLWGKSVQASQLKSSINDAFINGDYNKALSIYNHAVKDMLIGGIFKLRGNTHSMISNEVYKIKEDYLNNEISYEDSKKKLNFLIEFNILEAKFIDSVLKELEAIEKSRQALTNAENLLNNKEFEKALESLSDIREVDEDTYAKVKLLKEKTLEAYRQQIYLQVDEAISSKKLSEAETILADHKDILGDAASKDQEMVKDYSSDTKFLLLVDIDSQRTKVFLGEKGNWQLIKDYICSSGVPGKDTPKGTYTIAYRGEWFFSQKYQQGAKYWLQFKGDYLFHSLPMDQEKNIVDYTLGTPSSHGCVRLKVEEAKWLYDNIPSNTKLIIQ